MDSRRVDGRASARRYEESSTFSAAIRARYRLAGIRAAKGPGTIAKKGIIRSASSFGLFYAAMRARRFRRFPGYVNNFRIAYNIALHWLADPYSSIRDRPSIIDHSSIRDRPLMRNPSQIGEGMSVHPSKICRSWPLPSPAKDSGLFYAAMPAKRFHSIQDHSSIRDRPLMQNPSQIGEGMSIHPSKIRRSMPLSPPSSAPDLDEFPPGSSLLPLTGSMPLPGRQRDDTSGWKPTDIPGYGFSSLHKSPPGFFDEDAAKHRLTAISENGVLPSMSRGASVGEVHDTSRELVGQLMPPGREHPAIGLEAEPPEGYRAERRGMQMRIEGPLTQKIERLSSSHPGRRMEAMASLHHSHAGHPFTAVSAPIAAIAGRISMNMTSLEDMHRHITGPDTSRESAPAVPPSTRNLQSGASDSDLPSRRGRLEFSRPAHRIVPSNETSGPEEMVSITSSQRILPAGGPLPFVPSAQELNRISEQVCSIIERKLQIERERRGIYG